MIAHFPTLVLAACLALVYAAVVVAVCLVWRRPS